MAKEPHVYSFFQQRAWRCGGVSSSLWKEVNVQKRRPEVCTECKCTRCGSGSGKNTGASVHMPPLHPTSPPFKDRGVLRFLSLHFPTSQLDGPVLTSRNWIFGIENNSDPHFPTLKWTPFHFSVSLQGRQNTTPGSGHRGAGTGSCWKPKSPNLLPSAGWGTALPSPPPPPIPSLLASISKSKKL